MASWTAAGFGYYGGRRSAGYVKEEEALARFKVPVGRKGADRKGMMKGGGRGGISVVCVWKGGVKGREKCKMRGQKCKGV